MSLLGKIVWALDRVSSSRSTAALINVMLKDYGRLLDLSIDTATRRVQATLLLDGENAPITVRIDAYRIHRDADTTTLTIDTLSCDRAWIHGLLQRLVPGRPFTLPNRVAEVLIEVLPT